MSCLNNPQATIFLSTLSLRRATIVMAVLLMFSLYFYPRSPCGERHITIITICTVLKFLSTLSLRRATSIHNAKIDKHDDFYPRSPCGERRYRINARYTKRAISIHALLAESDNECTSLAPKPKTFLSTLSLRRATVDTSKDTIKATNFYPRSPCGERRWLRCWQLAARDISIHALLAESDSTETAKTSIGDIFLSTLSLRRATVSVCYMILLH